MTAKISGKTITLTRGDTLKATIEILNEDGTVYTPIAGDAVYKKINGVLVEQDDLASLFNTSSYYLKS